MFTNKEMKKEKELYKQQKTKLITFGKYKNSKITYKKLTDDPKYRYYRGWLLNRDVDYLNGELLQLYIFVKSRLNGYSLKKRLELRKSITYDVLDSDSSDGECLLVFKD